jgi:tRNA(Ile)-lysidine synthase
VRELIAFLRSQETVVPIDSHILIAVSGGADSMALAHLLVKYGRRIVNPRSLRLLHLNHRWRGEASDADARFVQAAAKRWGVPCTVVRLKPPKNDGTSWEEQARTARKAVFKNQAAKRDALVLTAHQADDLAETVLWRLLTGAADTHGGGILVSHGCELRPLLRTRKQELMGYLKEEGESWREDETNSGGRFLRSRMRLELLPVLEKLFPRAVEHLVKAALEKQSKRKAAPSFDLNATDPIVYLQAAGVKVRRPHWEAIQAKFGAKDWNGELHLPGGWKLSRKS